MCCTETLNTRTALNFGHFLSLMLIETCMTLTWKTTKGSRMLILQFPYNEDNWWPATKKLQKITKNTINFIYKTHKLYLKSSKIICYLIIISSKIVCKVNTKFILSDADNLLHHTSGMLFRFGYTQGFFFFF